MRYWIFYILLLPVRVPGQQYTLTVNGGYGDGIFRAGDTIHIWAREEKLTETFLSWSGDTAWLKNPEEWHTVGIMPSRNVSVTAGFRNLPTGAKLTFEKMQGRDTLKPVQYYFPPKGSAIKALVWVFHGTGGSFHSITDQIEGMSIVKKLIAHDYAVAISESEESTYKRDFDGDGNIRWRYTASADNVDMQNIQQIRDSFIARGYIDPSLPNMGIGFSAGGAFVLINGWLMKFTCGVSYCAPGALGIADKSDMPSQWFMGLNDNHPDVGKEGNDTAKIIYTGLIQRGICGQFNLFLPSPCYPEYFLRIPGIDSARSKNIFNELMSMGAFTARNLMKLYPDQIKGIVHSNPSKYPALASLTNDQIIHMDDQLIVLIAGHHVQSHFNGRMLRFLDEACGNIATPYSDIRTSFGFDLWPNPASHRFYIRLGGVPDQKMSVRLIGLNGKLIRSYIREFHKNETMEFSLPALLPVGLYGIQVTGARGYRHSEKLTVSW